MPIYINEFYNILSRSQGKNAERYAYLQPLPLTSEQRLQEMNNQIFVMILLLVLSFAFVSIFGLVFVVFEKEAEVKLHQFINSVEIKVYWLSNLLWD